MNFERKKIIKTLVVFNICNLVFFITIMNLMCYSSAIVWSEDFNDITEWTIKGVDWATDIWGAGNFSVDSNGVLWSYGAEWTNETQEVNFIYRNSTVDWGTWSYDMFIDDNPDAFSYVAFMVDDWVDREDWSHIKGYDIKTENWQKNTSDKTFYLDSDNGDPAFRLIKRDGIYSSWKEIGFYAPPGGVTGWHNFIITRDVLGKFNVYIDEILRFTVLDKNVTQSTYFLLEAFDGQGFDNITVSDSVDHTTTTVPETSTEPDSTTTTTKAATSPSFIPIFVSLVFVVILVRIRRR